MPKRKHAAEVEAVERGIDSALGAYGGTKRTRQKPKVLFQLGDRVTISYPAPPGVLWPRTHGIIVPYHGKHDIREPRVRWADGWGTSHPAADLRSLTPKELKAWPIPAELWDCDRR